MQVTCAAFRQSPLACRSQQQPHQQQRIIPHASPVQQQSRRQLIGLAAAAALTAVYRPAPAAAAGIESIDLPSLDLSDAVTALKARNQGVLDSAEKTFQESDLLRTLKERSDANRGARKKELEDRYCRRQAELGVGDCGGLRLIPGMTKSGVQKRPEFLNEWFGLPSQD
ncbi:hypothetical protein D9Q98_008588 [Chlorella vulgaris]|uniref:Uncharacterized protein n=1 Tax=Chlorella vulgaris TaxID=3077 RepID=A0A9D4YUD3_CHLVU|nr:hypothetical protein D9Q98_008588 [Chlorella vulgaris]